MDATATNRIAGLRNAHNKHGIFTSDFSVNEFLMVRKAGFEPIGLCLGSCVYHVGVQYSSWKRNEEMQVLSAAMYNARELAMKRMRDEAKSMGADGIIGVRLTIKKVEFDDALLEFIAIGTGVVHTDEKKNFRAHDGGPFTSDLSGQDFMVLLNSGYRPIEMVMGSCVYHVAHRGLAASIRSSGMNVELDTYSSAMYHARELAMERMSAEASQAKAEGVVGVIVEEKSHVWQSHIIEFFAIGTAVSPMDKEIKAEDIPMPKLVLPMN